MATLLQVVSVVVGKRRLVMVRVDLPLWSGCWLLVYSSQYTFLDCILR